MQPMLSVQIPTQYGEKDISVYHCDIAEVDEPLDVMTVSSFYRAYAPTPGTLGDAFRYYLSRQHWSDAYTPPLEQRLNEFAERIKSCQTNSLQR